MHEDANGNVCVGDDKYPATLKDGDRYEKEVDIIYSKTQAQEECTPTDHVPLDSTPEGYAEAYLNVIEALRGQANLAKPWNQTVSNIFYHPHTRELLSGYKGAVKEFDQGIAEALEHLTNS